MDNETFKHGDTNFQKLINKSEKTHSNYETLYLSDEEFKKFSDSVDESKPFSMTDDDLESFLKYIGEKETMPITEDDLISFTDHNDKKNNVLPFRPRKKH